MSAKTRVRAVIGAVLFTGFALLSMGCAPKAPVAPVVPPPPISEVPQ